MTNTSHLELLARRAARDPEERRVVVLAERTQGRRPPLPTRGPARGVVRDHTTLQEARDQDKTAEEQDHPRRRHGDDERRQPHDGKQRAWPLADLGSLHRFGLVFGRSGPWTSLL